MAKRTAKKTARKKVAARTKRVALTNQDWGKIHAKAWRDPKFRHLLETDPTAAIKCYGLAVGKTFGKMVIVRPRPASVHDSALEEVNPFPPSCC
jgi:hypothetical protein